MKNGVRKQCQKCHRTLVVPIEQDTCYWASFGKPSCCGELELHSADWEDSINNLVAIIRRINELHRFKESDLLNAAIEDLDCWSEQNATPQEMGWVGQDGLP